MIDVVKHYQGIPAGMSILSMAQFAANAAEVRCQSHTTCVAMALMRWWMPLTMLLKT